MQKVKLFFQSGYNYVLSEQEYQEFLEYKEWLNSPRCELEADINDTFDLIDDQIEDLHGDIRTIKDDMVLLTQRLDAQKLINKIVEDRLPKE